MYLLDVTIQVLFKYDLNSGLQLLTGKLVALVFSSAIFAAHVVAAALKPWCVAPNGNPKTHPSGES